MNKILQLKIVLEGINPKIWRRFLVNENINFQSLHEVIQIVMGWENYHMYEFCIDNEKITCEESGFNPAEASFHDIFSSQEFIKMIEKQDPNKGPPILDTNKINKILKQVRKNKTKSQFNINTQISKLITSENQKFGYIYDFGDNWMHTIIVEKIKNDEEKCPICLGGERACPPEDCGSVPGYYELIKIRGNKKNPNYEERIVEWLGEDHDFESFDIQEVNKKLNKIRK